MKTRNNYILKIIMLLAFVTFANVFPALAIDDFTEPEASDVPIDGGLSLLVTAGVAYGVKRIRQKGERK